MALNHTGDFEYNDHNLMISKKQMFQLKGKWTEKNPFYEVLNKFICGVWHYIQLHNFNIFQRKQFIICKTKKNHCGELLMNLFIFFFNFLRYFVKYL